MNNQSIKEVEEDLQSLRNKWIAKGETESFVNTVISKYAKMISLPVERISDEEIEAMAEKEVYPYSSHKADIIQFARKEGFIQGAKAIRDKLQSSSVKDEDKTD